MTNSTQLVPEWALAIYKKMALIRACDQRIQDGLKTGELAFQYYPCGGQEAIAATIGELIRDDDLMVTTYRGIHDIIAKGSPMTEVMAEMYGRMSGTSKGKGGPMHLSDPNSGLMVTTGIVGAGLPIANGLALAEQLKGTGRVVICNFGDGAANIGAFNETLNLAALWNLPIIFVCQNNLYAEYTSFADSTKSTSIASRAGGYGMPGIVVDGTSPVALFPIISDAIDWARNGKGPSLIECKAYRLQGHSFGSDESHMNAAELAEARENAPLKRFREWLISQNIATEDELIAAEVAAAKEVAASITFAEESQAPAASELYIDVFSDVSAIPGEPQSDALVNFEEPEVSASQIKRMTMCDAVRDALDIAMSRDESVILLGEDIADPAGGVAKATAGLSTKYGVSRVRATPISEQAIVGAAIGASLRGFKPVAEVMIVDFALVCMDQIANHAAKLRYMSGGRTSVPITLRMLSAANVGSFGAQHSQSLEAVFAHIPGLKVVMPSNAHDAKGLLLSCIDDPDPCIIIEAMRDYFTPGPVRTGDYRIPLGKAKIVRPGADLTLISFGWMLNECLASAKQLAKQNIDVEVIDLRSLVPLDMDTILKSVRKTKRVLIAHSAVEFCGFGAELSSRIHEAMFNELKAPVARLGAAYTPVPFAKGLESLHFPDSDRVVESAIKLIKTSRQ